MATKLTKDVIRETDITVEDKTVFVSLSPDEGGSLKFRVKGARKESSITLRKVFGITANIPRTPVLAERPSGDSDDSVDKVDLSTLESRVMIDGGEVMTPKVKGALFEIIREMREEAREDAGLPRIHVGTKAARQKEIQRDFGN